VSPEERSLVMALVLVPGGREPLGADEFLRQFGAADGRRLSLDLLRDATNRCDPIDVELALVVCFEFGFTDDHLQSLVELAFADWHKQHEDVATALGEIKSPSSIEALVHLAEHVPRYLEFDEFRALATKAIWALHAVGGEESNRALESLSHSKDQIVAENALARLQE
jgi:hypothetical protein